MHILHIDCSATDGMDSHSRRLSAALVEKFKAANAGTTVTYRDVAKDRLPHVDMTIRQAWSPEGEKDRDLSETAARSKAAVDQLKAANVLIIGAPMYNFSVPSTLKSWIDHVVIAGQTFRYGESGPVGLLTGKAYLALSSGGIYSQGPFASNEHLATYLTAVLRFIGISEVEVVRAEGVAYGPDQDKAAMAGAQERIAALVAA